MAPKKKEQQKMSLNDFLADNGFGGGSWADEVEETYVSGTQPLPTPDRARPSGGMSSGWQDRGYSSLRENIPQTIPDKPPYTAHLGNLSYDATVESVTEFFEGSKIVSVRIIEDREMQRPKGFGYVEFEDVESLKQALTLDGQSFQGRMIKIKVADPPRGGDSNRMGGMDSSRDLSDWTRRGPLPDLPGRSNNNSNRQPSDFGGERRRDPALESRPPREINWERRGPLPPLAQQEEGSGPRENSGPRGAGGVGMGERSESSRGPRPERPERAERTETAAEKDFQWRERMRPEAAAAAAAETPSSPTAAAAAPASRPRLNLQKRTVTEGGDASATSTPSDAKASPFGAARPIDTATREKEIEDKRQQALQEKREADDKAKEERKQARIAAAAKAESEAKEGQEDTKEGETAATTKDGETTTEGGEAGAETKVPIRSREPREPKDAVQNTKSRATEAGNWRSASGSEQRGPRGASGNQRGRGGPRGGRSYEGGGGRGGRANGSPAQQQQTQQQQQAQTQQQDAAGSDDAANTPDEDGWTTVPKKGRTGRPLA